MGIPTRTRSSKPLPGGSRRPGAMGKPNRTQSSKPLPGGSRRPGAMGIPNRTQSSKPLPGGSRRPGAMGIPTRTQSSKPLPGGSRRPGAMGIPESGKGLPQSKGAARYNLAALSGSRRPWDCCDSSQLCGRPRRFRRNPLRTHAFTLVEMLVVVAIIAIIAALGIPAFNRAMAGARTSGCMSDLRQVHAAMMAYASDHDGRLPLPWNAADGDFIWERALARPSNGGVYLPPESIHPGGDRKGNIRRLLFNREVAAMGGDPHGNDPNFLRSNYQMNHEFNLSFGRRHGGNLGHSPETMFRLASFEWPTKTMLLMSAWSPWYRIPHNRGRRGDLDWEGGPAFIHNGNKALVLYAAGNIGLLTKEEVPTDPATKEWREFWLPTLAESEWQ